MKNIFARFLKNEAGATAIEYGLIAGLLSISIILGATALGTELNVVFGKIATKFVGVIVN